jgi:hypothetical protein
MVGYAHNGHNRENDRQCAGMNRDEKDQRGDDDCAGHRLPRVKTHRSPRGWRAAFMMDGVGGLKPPGPVHQPVGPVKPSVMGDQIERDGHRQIPERIGRHFGINLRPAPRIPSPSDQSGGRTINASGQKRPQDLTFHLAGLADIKPGMFYPRCPSECAAGDQIAHADDQRHAQNRNHNGK